jgi:hypothetical protein
MYSCSNHELFDFATPREFYTCFGINWVPWSASGDCAVGCWGKHVRGRDGSSQNILKNGDWDATEVQTSSIRLFVSSPAVVQSVRPSGTKFWACPVEVLYQHRTTQQKDARISALFVPNTLLSTVLWHPSAVFFVDMRGARLHSDGCKQRGGIGALPVAGYMVLWRCERRGKTISVTGRGGL